MTGTFKIPAESTQTLAQVLLAIYQKVIYDQLLIKNDRQLDDKMAQTMRPQIALLLSSVSD